MSKLASSPSRPRHRRSKRLHKQIGGSRKRWPIFLVVITALVGLLSALAVLRLGRSHEPDPRARTVANLATSTPISDSPLVARPAPTEKVPAANTDDCVDPVLDRGIPGK